MIIFIGRNDHCRAPIETTDGREKPFNLNGLKGTLWARRRMRRRARRRARRRER
jgi:hypothetical protein